MSRDASDYLAALPPDLQGHLAHIARRAIGMSAGEKGAACAVFATVAAHFALASDETYDKNEPAADIAAEIGLLIRRAHERSLPEVENV